MTPYAAILGLLPRLTDDELIDLKDVAQFLFVRRQDPSPVVALPPPGAVIENSVGISIGSNRYRLDTEARAYPVKPEPAEVLPIDGEKGGAQ